ncbi:MAG: VOC family protein [Chloroflexota bacterium]|nr:VOC family protein [Chloroflexota bacterium]
MVTPYKPEGYTSVAPYLIVEGASATIEFLKRVFDAVEIRRFLQADGSIMHAEIRIDDTVLMIADGTSSASNVHVYVPDVDAVYRKALAAGAESVQAPLQKDDDDKRSGVKDAGGTTWWIATKMS